VRERLKREDASRPPETHPSRNQSDRKFAYLGEEIYSGKAEGFRRTFIGLGVMFSKTRFF
jgi:hypothetical protein